MLRTSGMCRAALVTLFVAAASSALAADDGVWSVSKSTGEVWITATGAQPASLKQEDALKPGDIIRTGRNGRVLLVRGEETILIAPNSVIGVPSEAKDGMSTTIQQQAGSILLEVEKRNVKHFEVETPYLAAVVKGTQFSVTIDGASTRVAVNRGQVEVADFKSGQIAQVLPGQAATSFVNGKPGLSLSGSGNFNPIEQSQPRASSIDRIPVPKGGLQAPRNGGGKTIHAVAPAGSTGKETAKGKDSAKEGSAASSKPSNSPVSREAKVDGGQARRGVVRISSALGEVKVNVNKATHGLAHGSAAPGLARNASRELAKETTIWSDSKSSVSPAYASSQAGSGGYAAAVGSSATAAATSAAVAVDSGSASDPGNNGNGNGNGNNGNGNGNAATGSGKIARIVNGVTGVLGVGNHGNGNGNGGVGNGNGNGNAKH
jgi:hypothetical protein